MVICTVSQLLDAGTVAVLLTPDFLKVTIPVCLLPEGVKLGSSVSLSTVLQEDVDRARRKQMIALQHRLIEVSSGPEEPVQSVLAWRSSSAAGPTSSNDAAAGGKAPKAAATASEAVFSLN